MPGEPRRFVSAKSVRKLLEISNTTLWRMVKAGEFPAPGGLGRLRRWYLDEVEAWIAANFKPGVPTSAQPAPEPPTT